MTKRTMPWISAALVLFIHALGNAHYGYFRDELYFIICGFHPQWGYVDQPPLVPLLAAATQLFGHSLWLLRMVPALFGAASAYTMCLLVDEFGGSVFAQLFATLVFICTLVLTSFGMKVSTDELNLWTWPLLAYVIVRLIKGADARLWLLAGAIAGITLESKYSIVFFLIALVAGLLLTPQRAVMRTPWFAGGIAVMLLIALPNFIWQAAYGFPMLELLRNGQDGKNLVAGPLLYLIQQVIITNLFLFPVWIIGLIWLLRKAPFRAFGFAYVLLVIEMIVSHGKHYYMGAVYPILIAAGGVAIESWTRDRNLARIAVTAYALVLGPVFIPFSLPVLSEPAFIAYEHGLQAALHIPKGITATEHGRESSELPGDWADMHGWRELAENVKQHYDALPPAERKQAVVFASNYGEASAIAFFTPDVPVISGHNQYWLWGSRGFSGNVVIDVNGDCGADRHLFRSATRIGTFGTTYSIGYERDRPIMLCQGLTQPWASVWAGVREYI